MKLWAVRWLGWAVWAERADQRWVRSLAKQDCINLLFAYSRLGGTLDDLPFNPPFVGG